LAFQRVKALNRGEVRPADIALGQRAWPEPLQKLSNSFENQLELPLLFYVLVILAIIARKADLLFVILSWLFVASRFAHAFIHTGPNVVRVRGPVYGVGMLILMVMWLISAVRVLAG